MANKKISQLDPIGTIDVNQDSIPIVDYSEGVTKRTNLANIGQRVLEASSTTNLAEGTNLYFTNTRVYTKVKATLLAGSNTSITFDDALQTITIASQGNVQSVNTKTGAVVLTTTDISEGTNLYYTQARFNSAFTAKSTSDLSEGTNEYFTAARVRAVVLTGISLVTNAVISATDSVLVAFGKLQAQITANLSTLTSHTSNTSNPHATTKSQVGLGNADNTSDANKPVSTATQTALNAKQDTLLSGTNIKTVNSTTLLGSGDIAVQSTLVSGTNIKTINGTTLLGSGDLTISTAPPTLAQVTTAGNTTANDINTGLITTTTSAAGNMFVANGANNTLLTVFNDSSGRATITIKGNLSATSAAGAYFGAEGYQEAWFNVYAKAANTGNKFWRFGNIGTGILNNVFAIQKLTDDGSAIALTALTVFSSNGNVGINTTTDAGYKLNVNGTARIQGKLSVGSPTQASAVMEITSTTLGFLPPRMTNAQRLAIASPAVGLEVYCTDVVEGKYIYKSTGWTFVI
jgi:hypothetical protein